MAVNILNSKADTIRSSAALLTTISAAKGLYDILKSNLGPKGTFKMLVSGSGITIFHFIQANCIY